LGQRECVALLAAVRAEVLQPRLLDDDRPLVPPLRRLDVAEPEEGKDLLLAAQSLRAAVRRGAGASTVESEASVMVVVGGAQGWEGDDWGLGAGLGWARFSLPLASRWLAVG